MLEKSKAIGTTLRCMFISAAEESAAELEETDEPAGAADLLLHERNMRDAARMLAEKKIFFMMYLNFGAKIIIFCIYIRIFARNNNIE